MGGMQNVLSEEKHLTSYLDKSKDNFVIYLLSMKSHLVTTFSEVLVEQNSTFNHPEARVPDLQPKCFSGARLFIAFHLHSKWSTVD